MLPKCSFFFSPPSLFFPLSCLCVWSQPTWIGINLGWNDNYPVSFNSDVMKWETGNVININGISSAFDWERNWIRLRKLGRIVNSVPSLLRDSYAFMPRLTPKCWIKHIAADNYLIPHSMLRLYACYCLVWNFTHEKWFVSHLSRGKLRSLLPPPKPSAEATYLTVFDRHIQHLNQSEFVVFEHIWRWEISDSARANGSQL